MDEEPRYAIRRGAVELTRRQWLSFGSVLVVGVALAVVLILAVSIAAGGIALSVTAVVAILILGFGRPPARGKD